MKYQDIHLLDVELQKQFVNLWLEGKYEEALLILKENPQLDSKKFVADIMNVIAKMIYDLENKYQAEFINALEMKFDKFNEYINNFIYLKEWQSSTSYALGNMVLYQDAVYICFKENTNIEPSNNSYWARLGLKGEQGLYNIGVVLKYDWEIDKVYAKNDLVVYDDTFWVAKKETSGTQPDTSVDWELFLKYPKATIITSWKYPMNTYDGLIFCKIVKHYIWQEINILNYTFLNMNQLRFNWRQANEGGW